MTVKDSQRRARNKWDQANMAVLGCKLRKDTADKFKALCKAAGTTPNAVFTEAVDSFISSHQDQAPADTSD